MKFLVGVCLLSALSSVRAAELTDEQKAKLKEHFIVCSKTTGADLDLLAKAKKGEFTDDPKVKKFFGCMFNKIGLMKNGAFQIDVMKSKMPKDIPAEDVQKLLDACKGTKGADSDETAYMIFKCYWEKSPQHLEFA